MSQQTVVNATEYKTDGAKSRPCPLFFIAKNTAEMPNELIIATKVSGPSHGWLKSSQRAGMTALDRHNVTRAIAARSDSPHTFYFRAQTSLALNDLPAAISDLERVVSADRKFDYYRAAGLLADAYARSGNLNLAGSLYTDVTEYSTTPETLYNYANYLKMSNRRDEARDWTQKLLAKKRTLPRYMERRERPWFRKASALLSRLPK